jgi:twitching motility protein PilT
MSNLQNRIAAEIAQAVQADRNITDIQIREGSQIFYKSPKGLVRSNTPVVTKDELAAFFDFVTANHARTSHWRERIKNAPTGDFNEAINLPGSEKRLRINGFESGSKHGLAAAIRCQPTTVPTMETLGVPEIMKFFLETKGLVLVTGPTGSGKSTTIASSVQYLNNGKYPRNINTIEDPIEYEIASKNCLVTQREVGTGHLRSMSDGVISSLRQNPNVIVVGEMREKETISASLRGASSGHLVLASMHTNNARDTVEAILSVYQGPEIEVKAAALASRLQGIISQQLVPLRDQSAYVLATELLIVNTQVRNAIRTMNFTEFVNLMDSSRGDNSSYTLNAELETLVRDNQITQEAALVASYDPDDLKKRLGLISN